MWKEKYQKLLTYNRLTKMTNETDKWIEERVMEFESAYMNNGINGVLRDEFQDTRTILIRNFLRTTLLAYKAHLKEQLLGEVPGDRIPPIGFPKQDVLDNPTEKEERWTRFGYNKALQDMEEIIKKL